MYPASDYLLPTTYPGDDALDVVDGDVNPFLLINGDELDAYAIAVNAARRALNVGTWLTSRPRVFPLRVVFPTDSLA